MTEIKLYYNRKHFEEIYFRNGRDKIFFSENTKGQTWMAIVVGVLLTASLIFNLLAYDPSWGLFVFLLIIFGITSIELSRRILAILKWKKSIRKYLDEIEKAGTYRIVLSENVFTLFMGSNEHIEKWTEFKRAELTDTHVSLIGSQAYLIARKSMSEEEFEIFKNEVGQRIRNG